MRKIFLALFFPFLVGIIFVVNPHPVFAQSCIDEGSMCADTAGTSLGTCCSGTACVAEPTQGLFSTCQRTAPPPVTTDDTEDGVLCEGTNEINTAIGCIPFDDPTKLTGFILRWAIGIAGGIAFLLIIYAGFMITTSQGDPKRLQAGRELLTSAIGGLMLLIFSVFILRVIGVDILQIPGLGTQ